MGGPTPAAGLLIPKDEGTAPLAMLDHKVQVTIDEQVAVTRVEQTFRNHTNRALEATYVFPVPRGANVNKFSMWVDGKEVKGELVEADKARAIYTDIVRRLQDPGLLEHVGTNLLRLRIFPVPANGDQKVALSFTSVNDRDAGLIAYTYPLRTDEKAARTQDKFSLELTIKSQHAVQNVYSPTHPITVQHKGDRVARVHFQKKQALLDKDFQLFYALGDKDVGITPLCHRPDESVDGHFMLLISPRADLGKTQQVSRDVVLVMDTSGSMSGPKIEQARKALKFCLDRLTDRDRFAVLHFATTVGRFSEGLLPVNKANVARARKWVDDLEANGGTAIDEALKSALDLRPSDTSRSFTVVFFTDGEPTVGETSPERIVKNVTDRHTSHTRLFTFGVGDDVNATLLDRLADSTRACSTYVRPEEDIEVKVSSLYAKISHPVLTDLKVTSGNGIQFVDTYPNKLPDLFHGGQVVVIGRYKGHGHKAIKLTGKVGDQTRELVYEVNFPRKTNDDKAFVEGLWARRKVGYLLDEIRRNGEKAELKDEVVKLAKKHGITTPYTSYLVVPDSVPPSAVTTLPVIKAPAAPAPGRIQYAPMFVAPGAPAVTYDVPGGMPGPVPLSSMANHGYAINPVGPVPAPASSAVPASASPLPVVRFENDSVKGNKERAFLDGVNDAENPGSSGVAINNVNTTKRLSPKLSLIEQGYEKSIPERLDR